ncbi:MAG: hypothetical protein P8188_00055 [Gemmatimonadota bacterium]|jgi:mono/diheme cytochrome c family protein
MNRLLSAALIPAVTLVILAPDDAGAHRPDAPDLIAARDANAPLGRIGAPDPSFADDIMPIFQESCVRCHGEVDESGFPYTEGGLSLMSYEDVMKGSEFGSVIEPGNPEDSYLLTQVENGDMPDEGDPLSVEQIELIRAWIEAGAPDN